MMRLAEAEAHRRLAEHDHGVLATVHPDRGVDAVPVVYAVDEDGFVGIPVDRVKPKGAGLLQRERNLAADPRATLLIDHWDATDWSALWWVRAELRWLPEPDEEVNTRLEASLIERYPQYRDADGVPFDRVLVFDVVGLNGWAAAPET